MEDTMKELRLNREEKKFVAMAERNGFEEWSYKSWRRSGEGVRESLTKSMVNNGEWALVKEYENGTRIKITTTDLDDISYYVMF